MGPGYPAQQHVHRRARFRGRLCSGGVCARRRPCSAVRLFRHVRCSGVFAGPACSLFRCSGLNGRPHPPRPGEGTTGPPGRRAVGGGLGVQCLQYGRDLADAQGARPAAVGMLLEPSTRHADGQEVQQPGDKGVQSRPAPATPPRQGRRPRAQLRVPAEPGGKRVTPGDEASSVCPRARTQAAQTGQPSRPAGQLHCANDHLRCLPGAAHPVFDMPPVRSCRCVTRTHCRYLSWASVKYSDLTRTS